MSETSGLDCPMCGTQGVPLRPPITEDPRRSMTMTETPIQTSPSAAEMVRTPDLRQGDVVVTETGVYRVTWPPRYYDKGAGLPAGIPCWHIPVETIAGSPRGGLVRTDWDYLQRFVVVQETNR